MFDSPIFQVIIGLIFIFSLLSVIVTQINTTIVYIFQLRAKSLKNGIHGLLCDPETRAKFMAHPLIQLIPSVVQPDSQLSAQAATSMAAEDPTGVGWIEPQMFSDTLIDILSAYADQRLFGRLYDTASSVLSGQEKTLVIESIRRYQHGGIGLSELQSTIQGLAVSGDRQVLLVQLESVEQMRRQLQADNEQSKLIPLLSGIQEIAEPGMRTALETLLASARTLDEARLKLETWFNARMGLVTEFYKRNLTRISYIVGIVIVVLLNADALQIGRTLWNDASVRQTVAVAATNAVNSGSLRDAVMLSEADLQAAIEQLNAPEATPEPVQLPTEVPVAEAQASAAEVSATSAFDDLLSLHLPLGWVYAPIAEGCPQTGVLVDPCQNSRNLWLAWPPNNPGWLGFWFGKLLGFAITVLAIAQGAPFWFDLLNRIARGRAVQTG